MRRPFIVIALFAVTGMVAQGADPFVGTYRLNSAKSTMTGDVPAAALTLVITEEGDNLVVATNGKRTDGTAIASKLAVPKKGGDVRVLEGAPSYDSAKATRTAPDTVQVVTLMKGKEGVRVQITLSPDRKVITRTIKGTNAQGKAVDGVSVLERQYAAGR